MLLKRREFVPNNIALREIGAMCIGKYKEAQAIALSDLIHNKAHEFSKTAREILLLKYDIWFRWLVEVEDVLRRNAGNKDVPTIILNISDDLSNEYIDTLTGNPDIFDKEYIDIWLKVHGFMYKYLRTKIDKLTVEDMPKFMVDVTDTLIAIMANTLFELHEIDTIFLGKKMFISFDDICIDYHKVIGGTECLVADRLKAYHIHFGNLGDSIIIKDYSQANELVKSKALYTHISEEVQKLGYSIEEVV